MIGSTEYMCSGPLSGLRILEVASLGPAPFAAMMLSDSGADVLRIDRPGTQPSPHPVLERGRRSVILDLKSPKGVSTVLKMIERADALIEGFRPGVMERLGLGPEVALARNPSLVYARMTGWGQDGPLAQVAGHDPNYVGLTGAVHAIGTPEQPVLPLNIVGDYGGGGMLLAFGIMSALWHSRATGEGQVVDAAIVDGVLSMMSALYGDMAAGRFTGERQGPGAYGSSPFSGLYRCGDGLYISLCAFEPHFYAALLDRLELTQELDPAAQFDRVCWPATRTKLAGTFASAPREHWCALFEGVDACFAPVISMAEAPAHPHHVARGAFMNLDGMTVPSPSPRYAQTPAAVQGPPSHPGTGGREVLAEWGFTQDEIAGIMDALPIGA
ncbi:CaiB/BaiF CoA-transferase family protein [Sphingobium sp.]|uniref:CaiB/BaiF CoA transferase family protein n=1 Tax=Sphingobium sp. TaxID=1912891 RepID=UPI002CC6F096|nr:CaiB/BaiF CoA-transferase family protein [Sphingobium sp.]HUD90850.1 CaiB/BaiF CoA-transferase family protein [Sphingobium sp.]